MERKLHPGVRPAHSVPRYSRPAIVASRNELRDAAASVVPEPQQPAPEVVAKTQLIASVPASKPEAVKRVDDIIRAGQPHRSVTRFVANNTPASTAKLTASSHVGVYFDMKPAALPKPQAPVVLAIPEPSPVTAQTESVTAPAAEPVFLRPVSSTRKREFERQRKPRRRFALKKPHLLYGMASLLFVVGVYVAIDGWLVNRAASTQTQVLAAQAADTSNDRDNLTEDKPTDTKGYKVAPDLPRTIQIPSIGVDARVLQLGVKANNELATPTNIHDAGWYTGSSKPTDKAGAILIDGHVSGPTKRGVFYDLKKLKAGDEIILERGDGAKLTFAVARTKTVKTEEVDMAEMMRSDVPTKLALNLITCGGTFDAKNNEFASRVLVFAVQK